MNEEVKMVRSRKQHNVGIDISVLADSEVIQIDA